MAEPHQDGGGGWLLWLLSGGGAVKLWSLYAEWRRGRREDEASKSDLTRKAAEVEAATKRLIAEHEEIVWSRTKEQLSLAFRNCDELREQAAGLEARVEDLETALETAHSAAAVKDRDLSTALSEVERLTILTTMQAARILEIQEDRNTQKGWGEALEAELIVVRGELAKWRVAEDE